MPSTITISYTAGTGFVQFTDRGGPLEFYGAAGSNTDPHPNPLVRTANAEFEANGTTSGTLTITAA